MSEPRAQTCVTLIAMGAKSKPDRRRNRIYQHFLVSTPLHGRPNLTRNVVRLVLQTTYCTSELLGHFATHSISSRSVFCSRSSKKLCPRPRAATARVCCCGGGISLGLWTGQAEFGFLLSNKYRGLWEPESVCARPIYVASSSPSVLQLTESRRRCQK